MLLVLLALAVRIHSVGFNSLSEDETAKWTAVEEYRHGHFAGVNSEHPMMLKVLAWVSLAAGERWTAIAVAHHWFTPAPEAWLRIPNVLFGAATAGMLYLLCRQAMGIVGSFMAGFFWAFSPLSVAINRLAKEETALTFFTLLACYLYWRAKTSGSSDSMRRWLDLSACAFGFSFAAQYIIHLFGLNQLAWHLAGRRGIDRRKLGGLTLRFFSLIGLSFLLANPLVLAPRSLGYVARWLHHDGVHHAGYDFAGHLYPNFASLFFSGVPWYFYIWMLLVKTPIPILLAVIAGSVLLLRKRDTVASCIFLSMGVVQLAGLSISGAKWLRYALPLLPFLYFAAGFAVQAAWSWAEKAKARTVLAALAGFAIVASSALELRAWSPYYSFYLNAIGGGRTNAARYFSPDETSEFDTRQVAEQACAGVPDGITLATGRPNSMTYYLRRCGRQDIRVIALYDPNYIPQDGDVIVLEPSRRFFETQKFFDMLPDTDMPHGEMRVGPVTASTMYVFRSSALASRSAGRLPRPQAKVSHPLTLARWRVSGETLSRLPLLPSLTSPQP
ncbi:MAG: glycosyltransferase family 39 protein [Acidobacteriales bacterium]|nr:glycosyltransferase family 39 protein [Terriglobales bacterium]